MRKGRASGLLLFLLLWIGKSDSEVWPCKNLRFRPNPTSLQWKDKCSPNIVDVSTWSCLGWKIGLLLRVSQNFRHLCDPTPRKLQEIFRWFSLHSDFRPYKARRQSITFELASRIQRYIIINSRVSNGQYLAYDLTINDKKPGSPRVIRCNS